ncbi:MAG: hypothetical protein JO057_02795 [Chloroflexi bacterium]|nr:hypothetical protein [Chloroflexota bacterium]
MRTGLVLLYWADRLDAVACTDRPEVIAALEVTLGADAHAAVTEFGEPSTTEQAQQFRDEHFSELCEQWGEMRQATRRRSPRSVADLAYALSGLPVGGPLRPWRLSLGQPSVPEPAMLIRRVLNGQAPEREAALPRRRLRRRPLCLLGAAD